VVDSADIERLGDCAAELSGILLEERLFGATLLIFANKQDIPSALTEKEIEQVCWPCVGVWHGQAETWIYTAAQCQP
jgi:signal recognition particle receptor subunit beta